MLELLGNVNWFVVLWLAVVVVFLAVELATVTLTSIWFAAGGLIALFVAMAGGGFAFQMVAFLIAAFGMFFATKPWADKVINAKKTSTNADRAIGEEVRVLERINNLDQTGRVVVHGQDWMARTEDDKNIIEQGELVRIVRISGVKVIVERVKED
ncbi:MAG: NfeD family protein [Agathobacter sp.]|nr:NfeD family protein [Agathobacter sp.]